MSPISEIMHKVDRAKEHLDALDEAIEIWRGSHANSVFTEDNVECGEYVVELRPPNPDIRIALIAGDFICCLRSSLDHLTWQLAATINPNPSKKICFPIIGENTIDNQVLFTKSTFGIPEEALITIRSLQPYQGGDTYKRKYLWILHTLWNIDKHRHIPLHSAVTQYNLDAASAKPLRLDKFEDHMRIIFSLSEKTNVKFQPMSKPEIFFGNEKEGVTVTVEHFRAIYEAIRSEIVPAFAGFFP
jgi:hypothetical protein